MEPDKNKPEIETQPLDKADIEKAKKKGKLFGDPILIIE